MPLPNLWRPSDCGRRHCCWGAPVSIDVATGCCRSSLQPLLPPGGQGWGQPLAMPSNPCAGLIHHPQQLMEQRLGLAELNGKATATQGAHPSTQPWPINGLAPNMRRQGGTGAGRSSRGQTQPWQPVLESTRRCDRRDLDHIDGAAIWNATPSSKAARKRGRPGVVNSSTFIHPLDRQQLRPDPGMAGWPARLRPLPFTASDRL